MIVARLMTGADLSYLGDAVWDVIVRESLLARGMTSLKALNAKAKDYVSAEAHAKIVRSLLSGWSEEEQDYYRRGRNSAPKHRRKGLERSDYCESSGFEALIGALYAEEKTERLKEITQDAFRVIEEEHE